MNQGKSVNMNKVLLEDAEENLDWKDFLKWTESLLVRLKSDKVERRFFEMCLAGRVKFLRNGEIKVFSLKNPTTRNIFGDFLYSSSLQNFMKIVTAGNIDDKLKKEVTSRIVTRAIFSVLIFLVPTIVSLLFRLVPLTDDSKNQAVNGATWSDCWEAAK